MKVYAGEGKDRRYFYLIEKKSEIEQALIEVARMNKIARSKFECIDVWIKDNDMWFEKVRGGKKAFAITRKRKVS